MKLPVTTRADIMLAIARQELPRPEMKRVITRAALKRNPTLSLASLATYTSQAWLLTRVAPHLDQIVRKAAQQAGTNGRFEQNLLEIAADTARKLHL